MATEGQALAPARPAGRRGWRIVGKIAGGVLGILILAIVGYAIATTPPAIPGRTPVTAFEPETVGRLEQRA